MEGSTLCVDDDDNFRTMSWEDGIGDWKRGKQRGPMLTHLQTAAVTSPPATVV